MDDRLRVEGVPLNEGQLPLMVDLFSTELLAFTSPKNTADIEQATQLKDQIQETPGSRSGIYGVPLIPLCVSVPS